MEGEQKRNPRKALTSCLKRGTEMYDYVVVLKYHTVFALCCKSWYQILQVLKANLRRGSSTFLAKITG
jgi:hypothetical protein